MTKEDKIRKEIIDFISNYIKAHGCIGMREWIAWLERARQFRDENCDGCKMCLESIFPELAESEDERIRKWIIEDLKDTLSCGSMADNYVSEANKAIAWLEKQVKESQIPTLRERYENIGKSEWFKRTHHGMSVSDDEKSKRINEDEKIRNRLIAMCQHYIECYSLDPYNIDGYKEALAWLEKQDNKEPKKVSIWKHWKDGISGNGEGEQIYLIKSGLTYSISSCLGYECDYIELSVLDKLMLEERQDKKNPNSEKFKDAITEIKKIIAQNKGLNRSHREKVFQLLDYLLTGICGI